MKKIFAAFIIITAVSCSKETSVLPVTAATAASQANTDSAHYIGEHFGGGIIFYLNATGKHGLIAAPEDLEEPSVWSYSDTLTHAAGVKIGAGHYNTNAIFRVQGDPGEESEDYAALECYEYESEGYTRWFLPSKDELNELYKQKDIVGGLKPYAYWTSTEAGLSKAWFQNLGTGLQLKASKIASYAIRPIRYF